MTHVQRVRDTLLAAAQTGALVSTCPVSRDADDTLRYVATCINRTTLARRIQISFSNETYLALDVRNRRLLQFSTKSRSSIDCSNDMNQRDTICALKDIAEIAQRLSSLLKDSAILHHRVVNDPTIIFPTTSGVSATAILQCIEESGQPDATFDLVPFLTKRIEDAPAHVLGACVLTSEDILAICGSDEQLLAMVDWAKPVLENPSTSTFPISCKVQSDGACFIDWRLPTPRRLLILNASGQMVLVLVENDPNVGFLSELRAQLSFY